MKFLKILENNKFKITIFDNDKKNININEIINEIKNNNILSFNLEFIKINK